MGNLFSSTYCTLCSSDIFTPLLLLEHYKKTLDIELFFPSETLEVLLEDFRSNRLRSDFHPLFFKYDPTLRLPGYIDNNNKQNRWNYLINRKLKSKNKHLVSNCQKLIYLLCDGCGKINILKCCESFEMFLTSTFPSCTTCHQKVITKAFLVRKFSRNFLALSNNDTLFMNHLKSSVMFKMIKFDEEDLIMEDEHEVIIAQDFKIKNGLKKECKKQTINEEKNNLESTKDQKSFEQTSIVTLEVDNQILVSEISQIENNNSKEENVEDSELENEMDEDLFNDINEEEENEEEDDDEENEEEDDEEVDEENDEVEQEYVSEEYEEEDDEEYEIEFENLQDNILEHSETDDNYNSSNRDFISPDLSILTEPDEFVESSKSLTTSESSSNYSPHTFLTEKEVVDSDTSYQMEYYQFHNNQFHNNQFQIDQFQSNHYGNNEPYYLNNDNQVQHSNQQLLYNGILLQSNSEKGIYLNMSLISSYSISLNSITSKYLETKPPLFYFLHDSHKQSYYLMPFQESSEDDTTSSCIYCSNSVMSSDDLILNFKKFDEEFNVRRIYKNELNCNRKIIVICDYCGSNNETTCSHSLKMLMSTTYKKCETCHHVLVDSEKLKLIKRKREKDRSNKNSPSSIQSQFELLPPPFPKALKSELVNLKYHKQNCILCCSEVLTVHALMKHIKDKATDLKKNLEIRCTNKLQILCRCHQTNEIQCYVLNSILSDRNTKFDSFNCKYCQVQLVTKK